MKNYVLKLDTQSQSDSQSEQDFSLNLPLEENEKSFYLSSIDSFIQNKVYTDKSYKMVLSVEGSDNDDIGNIAQLKVLINGEYIQSTFQNGEIYFNSINYANGCIFRDYFGFIQISLEIVLKSGEEMILHTPSINVMVLDDKVSKSIKKISEYVYTNQKTLLVENVDDDSVESVDSDNIPVNNIEAQLNIIKDTIEKYEAGFMYFKQNSKFTLVATDKVDNFEKLKNVNNRTIQYISSHPNELYETNIGSGFMVNHKPYLPKKTLVTNNEKSMDIYENRVVVNFLYSLVLMIDELQNKVKKRIDALGNIKSTDGDYMISAFNIYGFALLKLEQYIVELDSLKLQVKSLYDLYSSVIPVSKMYVSQIPKPTKTFMSIQYYRYIYSCISNWFEHQVYDLEKEDFLLPFLSNSQLYEYYVLLKLNGYFENIGARLIEKTNFKYKNPSIYFSQDLVNCNTYRYALQDKEITLYYQPVIYSDVDKICNGLKLVRNTTLSMSNDNDKERNGTYYLPDYVIKIEQNGKSEYIICDAKFSTVDTVKSFYFPSLAFKYVFSISGKDEDNTLRGICAINGKSSTESSIGGSSVGGINSVYNSPMNFNVRVGADIVTITEYEQEETNTSKDIHMEILDKLFEKYI